MFQLTKLKWNIKSPKFYLKLAETIHGVRSYARIPLLSKWIKVNFSL